VFAGLFNDIGEFNIESTAFIVALAALVLAFVGLAIFGHQKLRWRLLFAGLAAAMAVLTAGALVNRHFDHFDTVNELFGQNAHDEAPADVLTKQKGIPNHGFVITQTIPGTISGFKARQALVYVPPAYFRTPRPKLPVFVLLHGTPGTTSDWTRGADADLTTDAFARRHGGMAPILVLPDINGSFTGDTECVDSDQGRVETYLTEDVRRFVSRKFGTATRPGAWVIGGLSEGGTCSVWLALRHPKLWRTFASFSGQADPQHDDDTVDQTVKALFGGSRLAYLEHTPEYLFKQRRFPGLGGWFEVGSDDTVPYKDTKRLVPLARAAGIEACLKVIPNGIHDPGVWTQGYEDALPWLAARVGLTPMTPAAQASCRR